MLDVKPIKINSQEKEIEISIPAIMKEIQGKDKTERESDLGVR